MASFRTIADKVLHDNNVVFTFMRSIVSSQAASWVDMAVRFVLFAWVNFLPFLATACGCVAGGVVNCIINYKFTFHASDCNVKAVAVKYALVWAGSLLLNSGGTALLYKLLLKWLWLETVGFKPDGYFVAATLIVSLIVSWGWNFVLQRNFVYRPVRFDRFAIAAVDALTPRKNNTDNKS